jgi:hypothetical protein
MAVEQDIPDHFIRYLLREQIMAVINEYGLAGTVIDGESAIQHAYRTSELFRAHIPLGAGDITVCTLMGALTTDVRVDVRNPIVHISV